MSKEFLHMRSSKSQDFWLPVTDYPRAFRSSTRGSQAQGTRLQCIDMRQINTHAFQEEMGVPTLSALKTIWKLCELCMARMILHFSTKLDTYTNFSTVVLYKKIFVFCFYLCQSHSQFYSREGRIDLDRLFGHIIVDSAGMHKCY